MPNWAFNRVIITGDAKTLKEILEQVKDGGNHFSLNKIVSIPKEIRDTSSPSDEKSPHAQYLIEKYGSPDWYHWCIKNWGTKWDVMCENAPTLIGLGMGVVALEYNFDSAWNGPTVAVIALSKQHPSVTIVHRCADPGMNWDMEMTVKNGEVSEHTKSFDEESERYWEIDWGSE